MPYMMLLILSFNRDACGFLVSSSEFWIKICYAVVNGILHMVLYHQVGRKQRYREIPEWLGYAYHVCWLVSESLFMAIVGGMDAVPKMKYKWKICLVATNAFIYTGIASIFQFVVPVEDDYIIEVKATGSVISFHAMMANVNAMLAMFLWKQVIDVVRNKDRCISINYKPYLRWEPAGNDSDLLEAVIPEASTVVIEERNFRREDESESDQR